MLRVVICKRRLSYIGGIHLCELSDLRAQPIRNQHDTTLHVRHSFPIPFLTFCHRKICTHERIQMSLLSSFEIITWHACPNFRNTCICSEHCYVPGKCLTSNSPSFSPRPNTSLRTLNHFELSHELRWWDSSRPVEHLTCGAYVDVTDAVIILWHIAGKQHQHECVRTFGTSLSKPPQCHSHSITRSSLYYMRG